MQLDDLLYHIHHPESLDQYDADYLKSLIDRYPYLESLKMIYQSRLGQETAYQKNLNLEQRLDLQVAANYLQGLGDFVTYPPVFELPEVDTKTSENEFRENTHEVKLVPEPAFQPENLVFDQKNTITGYTALYPTEESEYVRYLRDLPKTKVLALDQQNQHTPSEIELTNQMIQSSVEWKESVGSESLAHLWAAQGQYKLAIQLYEKLIIENPEKSSIFAAKIAKLKAENLL